MEFLSLAPEKMSIKHLAVQRVTQKFNQNDFHLSEWVGGNSWWFSNSLGTQVKFQKGLGPV